MARLRISLVWSALAFALFVLGVVEISQGGHWHSADRPLDVVFLLVILLPLTRIDKQPALMATIFVGATFTQCALFDTPQSAALFFAALVTVFGVVTYADLRTQLLLLPVWSLLPIALYAFDTSGPDTVGDILFVLAIWAIVAGAGWVARIYRAGQYSAELEAEQVRQASAAAVVEERGRIARDLHDVVAHGVSLIVVQAAAGRSLLARDPEAARASFDTIEASGQQALAELRRMLDVMRETTEPAGLPQPGLSSLESLAESARATGTPVTVRIGSREGVDAGVSVSAYRIVQEALTNVVKHAPGAAVEVVIVSDGDELTVEVNNAPAPAPASSVTGAGYGIAGMRERAALYDGTVEVGPHQGGWRVLGRLRLHPAASALRGPVGAA